MNIRQLKFPKLPRLSRNTTCCIASLLLVSALIILQTWQVSSTHIASDDGAESYTLYSSDGALPNLLSSEDAARYKLIFRAQKTGDLATAKIAESKLSSHILMGHVLAERYLGRHYQSTASEMKSWLAHNADLPQAGDVYELAMIRSPSLAGVVHPVRGQYPLAGYGDDNALAMSGKDTAYIGTWRAGIEAWRNGHKEEAARLFSLVADQADRTSGWLAAASGYWAWRAYDALGQSEKAQNYLTLSAAEPRSFYGILARKQLNRPLGLDSKPLVLSGDDVDALVENPAIRRTIALAQAGQPDLAEQELRLLFPKASSTQKMRLLSVAHELNLASVQVSMARALGRESGRALDFARYPIPSWKPDSGFNVDPSLIFALIRQESGFRATAISPGGALGLMQLMPQTASFMQKRTANLEGPATDPTVNIALGQNYVRHLLDNELVSGNLFYMLVAYNAGAGRLQEWQRSLNYHNDPLLFVESIPFAETRYYVQQVMTNFWIYSELAGNPHASVYALLEGNWPWYERHVAPVAANDKDSDNPS